MTNQYDGIPEDLVWVGEPADWYWDATDADIGIRAGMTDAEVAALAQSIIESLPQRTPDYYLCDFVGGVLAVESYLKQRVRTAEGDPW